MTVWVILHIHSLTCQGGSENLDNRVQFNANLWPTCWSFKRNNTTSYFFVLSFGQRYQNMRKQWPGYKVFQSQSWTGQLWTWSVEHIGFLIHLPWNDLPCQRVAELGWCKTCLTPKALSGTSGVTRNASPMENTPWRRINRVVSLTSYPITPG